MADPLVPSPEAILQFCLQAQPNPWYPTEFVRSTGVPRAAIDPLLDQLRLNGFIRLTDWVRDIGQGYALTPAGMAALDSPRVMANLRAGVIPHVELAPIEGAAAPPQRIGDWERGDRVLQTLRDPVMPWVTFLLISLNVLVFTYGMYLTYRAKPDDLNSYLSGNVGGVHHQIGALTAVDVILGSSWWRLLSCCFVHFGLMHIGLNMYGLYVLGTSLERLWGHFPFLLLYLIAGVGGSCAVIFFKPGEGLLAGASGAIWGLMGSEVSWLICNQRYLPPAMVRIVWSQLRWVFLINIGISLIPSISATAHFGGGVIGFLCGLLVNSYRFDHGFKRLVSMATLLSTPVACVGGIYWARDHSAYFPPLSSFIMGRVYPGARYEANQTFLQLDELYIPMRELDPERRNPDLLPTTIGQLEVRMDLLARIAALLQGATALPDTRLDSSRKALVEFIDSEQELLRTVAACYRAGPNWPQQEDEKLGAQWKQVQLYRKRYVEVETQRLREAGPNQ